MTDALLDRELGPVWQEYAGEAWVSTIYRESSAVEGPRAYFETMAFPADREARGKTYFWHSSASFERAARRQHDLAVRWFSTRPPTTSPAAQEKTQ